MQFSSALKISSFGTKSVKINLDPYVQKTYFVIQCFLMQQIDKTTVFTHFKLPKVIYLIDSFLCRSCHLSDLRVASMSCIYGVAILL